MQNINPTYCNSSIEPVQSTFLNNPPLSENNIFYMTHSIDVNSCYDNSYESIINSYNTLFANGEVPILNSQYYNPPNWLYNSLIELLSYEESNDVVPPSFYDSVSLLAYNVATSLPQWFTGDYEFLISDLDYLSEESELEIIDEEELEIVNEADLEVINDVSCSQLVDIISQPFESIDVDLRDDYILYLREYLTSDECVTDQSNASIIALAIDRITLMIYNADGYMDYDANGGAAGTIIQDVLSTPQGTPQVIKTSLATFIYNFIYGFNVLGIEEGDLQFNFYFEYLGISMEEAEDNLDYITSSNVGAEEDITYECPTCESCPTTFRLRGVVDTFYGELSIEGSYNSNTGKTSFKAVNEGKPFKTINEGRAKVVSGKVKW